MQDNGQCYTNHSKMGRVIKWQDVTSQKYRANSFFSKRMGLEEELPGAIDLLLLSGEEPKLLFTDEPRSVASEIQEILIEAFSQILRAQTDSALSRMRAFRIFIKQSLGPLYTELEYLINGYHIICELTDRGYPISFPQLVSAEERTFTVKDTYHPSLAYAGSVTFNPVNFNEWGDILLLSGINTGGKTTYLQTIGAIQLFAQLGLPVPGRDAVISVADHIISAFSVNENTKEHQGKLYQELDILKNAMGHIGPNCFFLFNEPLTGSSPVVCTGLMNEILSILKVTNSRGIWVSHLNLSVEKYEAFNMSLPGARIGSIYVSPKDGVPDYRIHVGLPPKNRYATELFKEREHII